MKFRSWNENNKEFCYFEDGKYYYIEDRKTKEKRIDERSLFIYLFWKHAEQSTIIVDVTCFCDDVLIISYAYNKYNEPDNQIEKSVKGVLKIDNMGFYIENQEGKTYLSNLPTIFDCLICGNIHEKKEV